MKQTKACGKESINCIPPYNLEKSTLSLKNPICKNGSKCTLIPRSSSNLGAGTGDMSASSLTDNTQGLAEKINQLSEIGCFSTNPLDSDAPKICCKGELLICAAMQYLLLRQNYNIFPGASLIFDATVCRALPQCFGVNNSSPYILGTIPAFTTKFWAGESETQYGNNIDNTGFSKTGKVVNAAFGVLGASSLSNSQGIIYFLSLPPLNIIEYMSFTPYIFSSSRYGDAYGEGNIMFTSLTDAFNIQDIKMQLTNEQNESWCTNSLKIMMIITGNKTIACDIASQFQSIDNEAKEYLRQKYVNIETDIPIFCLPLPASSASANTWGKLIDPLGRRMYKDYQINKTCTSTSTWYDPEKDTIEILLRVVHKTGQDDTFNDWINTIQDQQNIVVIGFERCHSDEDELFTLNDQNGKFIYGDTVSWRPGSARRGEGFIAVPGSSWKKQYPYLDSGASTAQDQMKTLIKDMNGKGYNKYEVIPQLSVPSPFMDYNDYVASYRPCLTPNEKLWSQCGCDLIQFNISTLADCRDTNYPSSGLSFCLGVDSVGVIMCDNFMKRGTDKSFISYNSLNVYSLQSNSAIGSFRGDARTMYNDFPGDVYSMAFSKQDLSCPGNLPQSVNHFTFIGLGPHQQGYVQPDTGFYTLSRSYLHVVPESDSNFYTSATQDSIPVPVVIVFSPCKEKHKIDNPDICNNLYNPSPSPTNNPDVTCASNTPLITLPSSSSSQNNTPTTSFEPPAFNACSPLPQEDTLSVLSCNTNDKNKVCSNDLKTQANAKAQAYDLATSAACQYFRDPKVSDKTGLTIITALLGTLVGSAIIIYCAFGSKMPASRIWLLYFSPLFLLVTFAFIYTYIRLKQLTNQTAYSYKIASEQ